MGDYVAGFLGKSEGWNFVLEAFDVYLSHIPFPRNCADSILRLSKHMI